MEVPLPRAVSCLDPMLGLPAMIRAHDGLWRLPGLAVPVARSRRQGPLAAAASRPGRGRHTPRPARPAPRRAAVHSHNAGDSEWSNCPSTPRWRCPRSS